MRRGIVLPVVVAVVVVAIAFTVRGGASAQSGTYDYLSGPFTAESGFTLSLQNGTGDQQTVTIRVFDAGGDLINGPTQRTIPARGSSSSTYLCTDCTRNVRMTTETNRIAPTLSYDSGSTPIRVHPGSWLLRAR